MRRIVSLLLALLLLTGCAAAAPAAPTLTVSEATAAATAAPEPEASPGATGPFLQYRFYDQPNWEKLTSAVMFQADLDQDGAEEPVSFVLDPEAWTTAITWGESTIVLEEGSDFIEAAVLDLDAGSPFYNLLVTLDYGSDSYVTVELHPENGQLVKGPVLDGSWGWSDGALHVEERTDFLGTAFGTRTYTGDALVPDGEWLTMSDIPTEQEIREEWEYLVDMGILLHTVLPVSCTVNGQPYTIPEDSYLYRLRVLDSGDMAEVSLLDGTVAMIYYDVSEPYENGGWDYLIDGRVPEEYFDNLFFAD